jgi:uncharacterized SAM-binding protein YcdF (DUF218 family)
MLTWWPVLTVAANIEADDPSLIDIGLFGSALLAGWLIAKHLILRPEEGVADRRAGLPLLVLTVFWVGVGGPLGALTLRIFW